jgi:hypothetical protein
MTPITIVLIVFAFLFICFVIAMFVRQDVRRRRSMLTMTLVVHTRPHRYPLDYPKKVRPSFIAQSAARFDYDTPRIEEDHLEAF